MFIKQKKALRIINNAGFYDHTNELFMQCILLKFAEIVKLKTACVMFKAYHNKLPSNVQHYFEVGACANVYGTRQKDKFKTNFVRTNLKSNCVSVVGVKIWNSLPEKIRDSITLFTFKSKLKQYFLVMYGTN